MRSSIAGTTAFNRFYYEGAGLTGIVTPGDADGALTIWLASVKDAWLAATATDATLLEAKCEAHSTTSLAEASRAIDEAGTRGAESLPPQDAALITWEYPAALVGGRIIRGRTFVSGIAEEDQSQGFLSLAGQTAVEDLATALMGPFGVLGGAQHLQIWSPSGSAFHVVSDFHVDRTLKTLRRRRPGS
jgi:hypothetical protein